MSSEDNHKTSEKTKENIQKAVDSISNMLSGKKDEKKVKSGSINKTNKNKSGRKDRSNDSGERGGNHKFIHYDSNHHNRKYLWMTVGFLTLLIMGLWVYNVKTSFYDFQHADQKQATQLINDTQQDLDSILADFQKATQAATNTPTSTENNTTTQTNELNQELEQAIEQELQNVTTNTSSTNTTTTSSTTISNTNKNTSTNSNTSN